MILHSKAKLALTALACTFLLVACRSQEEKVRALYNEALVAKRNNNRTLYESLLREVGEKYKSTELATAANAELNIIEEGNRAARQTAANTLRLISTNQVMYRVNSSDGKYAPDFQTLVHANLLEERFIDPDLKEPEHRYIYEMKVSPDGRSFSATANPTRTDGYYFYIGDDFRIRFAIGQPASRVSPEFSGEQ